MPLVLIRNVSVRCEGVIAIIIMPHCLATSMSGNILGRLNNLGASNLLRR